MFRLKDPKFGYHVLWIVPTLYLLQPFIWAGKKIKTYRHTLSINRTLKQNPELKEIVILAGTHKRKD